jgi:hypothetical protein
MPMRSSEAARATASAAGGATARSDDAEFSSASTLTMKHDGAALHASAALAILTSIETALADVPPAQAGVRLHGIPALSRVLATGPLHNLAASHLGPDPRPVRAVLFDKSPGTNWALGWHQDRTIAVRERHDVPGFERWSTKAGIQHVEPPFDLLERMVTIRIHLDPVPDDNAPLLIALGSHRLGKVADHEAEAKALTGETYACLAERGDVWAYATPILHASGAAAGHRHRRVLQIDWSADTLPAPLSWLGV